MKKKRHKIDFLTCLYKIMNGEKIKVECNTSTFYKFLKYDKQMFINSEWNLEIKDFKKIIKKVKYIKNIYLIT